MRSKARYLLASGYLADWTGSQALDVAWEGLHEGVSCDCSMCVDR
jgi:hypothetical protein